MKLGQKVGVENREEIVGKEMGDGIEQKIDCLHVKNKIE